MRHKKLFIIPLLIGAALAAGVAFAAWTSSGSGSGQAGSTTSLDSVITPGTNSPDLYPGSTSSVTVTVNNPNAYAVVVTSISAGSSNLVNGTCAAGTVTSDARAMDTAGLEQTAGGTAIAAGGSGEFTLVTHMTTGALDSCKLQTFTLPLTATLASAA
jgi:hypothetical protein